MFAPSPVLHSPGSHQCAVTTNCPFYLIFFFLNDFKGIQKMPFFDQTPILPSPCTKAKHC